MINFFYESSFSLSDETKYKDWLISLTKHYKYSIDELNYIFCDDAYLLDINLKYLNHDTYTDIITFDNTLGKSISSEIYISIERIIENASEFNCSFLSELQRVMSHGVLHCMGFNDKNQIEAKAIRKAENHAISLF